MKNVIRKLDGTELNGKRIRFVEVCCQPSEVHVNLFHFSIYYKALNNFPSHLMFAYFEILSS